MSKKLGDNRTGDANAEPTRAGNGANERDQPDRFTHGQPALGQRARELQSYGEVSVPLHQTVKRGDV